MQDSPNDSGEPSQSWRSKLEQKFLDILERRAKPEHIVRATKLLWEHGYRNFNLDLIFAIPGQTIEQVRSDIRRAAELGPRHLSAYNLTLKPGHPFFSQLPSGDTVAELYEVVMEEMQRLGFSQYEISNYAQEGYDCRHNILYWGGGDYLGIGPSASSRFFVERKFVHHKQVADSALYLKNPTFDPSRLERTDTQQTVLEAVFLEMRRNSGVELSQFQERYGFDLRLGKDYKNFLQEALTEEKAGVVSLTPKGRLLADSVTERLADYSQIGT